MSFDFTKDLNPEQKRAVIYNKGPLLILAGAGSGKTRALTYRAAFFILEKGIEPENILLVTFTNKAAAEMKMRIAKLLSKNLKNKQQSLPYAGTFHSFCARLLRIEGRYLGIAPNYLIYDTSDQTDLIKQAMGQLGISVSHFKPVSILSAISSAKNELVGSTEYPQYSRGIFQKTVAQVYLKYQKLLRKYEALDFDDLLFEAVKLFWKNPEVLAKYQHRFSHILVDEYQDTNKAQYELTKLLAKKWRHLTVVADASQSIYGWRGANFRNVLNLSHDFPDLQTFNLEQNYRSKQTILDAAHAVISHNTTHPVLKLWTKKDKGEKIKLYQARSEKDEAQFLVWQIKLSMRDSQSRYSDFAVFYRTNAQSRVLEETFLEAAIPYLLVGGIRFYQRKEIKDCLAYLHLLINKKDLVSFRRIKKLGKRRTTRFFELVGKLGSEGIKKYSSTRLLGKVLKATDYLSLYDRKNEQDFYRLENIKELDSVAAEFPKLEDFLENVALVEQEYLPVDQLGILSKLTKNKEKKNAVILMTAHAAKGLEFKTVFMVGMEEGLFPHSRSLLNKEAIEEERRLAYVGITRAQDRLFLIFSLRRLYFGIRSSNQISRFIAEIPQDLLEFIKDNDYPSSLS